MDVAVVQTGRPLEPSALVEDRVEFRAAPSDPQTEWVAYRLDGRIVPSSIRGPVRSPFTFAWHTALAYSGTHYLEAVGLDAQGAETERSEPRALRLANDQVIQLAHWSDYRWVTGLRCELTSHEPGAVLSDLAQIQARFTREVLQEEIDANERIGAPAPRPAESGELWIGGLRQSGWVAATWEGAKPRRAVLYRDMDDRHCPPTRR